MQFTGHSLPLHQSMTVAWDFTLMTTTCLTGWRWPPARSRALFKVVFSGREGGGGGWWRVVGVGTRGRRDFLPNCCCSMYAKNAVGSLLLACSEV